MGHAQFNASAHTAQENDKVFWSESDAVLLTLLQDGSHALHDLATVDPDTEIINKFHGI
jgi:hypothetical protein